MELTLEEMYLEYCRLESERDRADREAKELFASIKRLCDHPMEYRYDHVILNDRYHYCEICMSPIHE